MLSLVSRCCRPYCAVSNRCAETPLCWLRPRWARSTPHSGWKALQFLMCSYLSRRVPRLLTNPCRFVNSCYCGKKSANTGEKQKQGHCYAFEGEERCVEYHIVQSSFGKKHVGPPPSAVILALLKEWQRAKHFSLFTCWQRYANINLSQNGYGAHAHHHLAKLLNP